MGKAKYIVIAACLVAAAIAAFNLWSISASDSASKASFDSLATQVGESGETGDQLVAQLQNQNPHTVGWINVSDTAIDYPVMQTTHDPEYYLTRNFDGAQDAHGVPFMAADCVVGSSTNLTVFGHNMNDGSMFHDLDKFRDSAFAQTHTVTLHTLAGQQTYQPVVTFTVSESERDNFPYHRVVNLTSPQTYDGFLARCRQYAVWQADAMPVFGTPLLTLSTCEYTKASGRLVVVAALVE